MVDMQVCRTCSELYAFAGDGWDGECPDCADRTAAAEDKQIYRIEIRFDFTGTLKEAQAEARRVAGQLGGDVTDIMDEEWESV